MNPKVYYGSGRGLSSTWKWNLPVTPELVPLSLWLIRHPGENKIQDRKAVIFILSRDVRPRNVIHRIITYHAGLWFFSNHILVLCVVQISLSSYLEPSLLWEYKRKHWVNHGQIDGAETDIGSQLAMAKKNGVVLNVFKTDKTFCY